MSERTRKANDQETMAGNLKEKPGDAASFDDNQYAGGEEPVAGRGASAGGSNVSRQGGGTGSSKQGGNTGSTPNASG